MSRNLVIVQRFESYANLSASCCACSFLRPDGMMIDTCYPWCVHGLRLQGMTSQSINEEV